MTGMRREARRTGAGAASDVDLLITGDVEEVALHRAVTQAEGHLARAVNCTLLDQREFAVTYSAVLQASRAYMFSQWRRPASAQGRVAIRGPRREA